MLQKYPGCLEDGRERALCEFRTAKVRFALVSRGSNHVLERHVRYGRSAYLIETLSTRPDASVMAMFSSRSPSRLQRQASLQLRRVAV